MAFIVAAKRTPFGSFGGALKNKTPTELGVIASKAALASGGVDPAIIDSSIWGNVCPTAADTAYMSRHIALKVGCSDATPAVNVNRLCGSGFQSIVTAVQEINSGDANVVLTGGSENMSMAPFAARNMRFGTALGTDYKLEDTLWQTLTDMHTGCPMAITAENLAEQYSVSREECDAFALRSQHAAQAATEGGLFDAEMAPIEVKTRKGPEEMTRDEHPRANATLDQLAKLPAIFKKNGTVTAGNASGICDGAGAVVVASGSAVDSKGLEPLARIVSYQVTGVDPNIMGIGPVPAIKGALDRAGLTLADMSIIEVNEAFAPQFLACEKALGLDRDVTNACGGAIALGHPVGASGARIMAHVVHRLQATGGKYGIGSACIGGGQGIAIVVERC
jgi:acetyl-CoA acyltransferase 2